MKIVVIGGTGLIGSKLVKKLNELGHETVAASPSKGINTITGEGLEKALKDTNVVVDVANSPSFEDKAVLEFFKTSNGNLLPAEKKAGVSHHIALSVVGTDLLAQAGYFRAKMEQENLIKASKIPYTIVRSTQFFEFLGSIAQSGTEGQTVHLSSALLQPIAADDVVTELLRVISEGPINGIVEIAGPERFPLTEIVNQYLKATKDPRKVVKDPDVGYFGIKIDETTLVPVKNAHLGSTDFKSWFASQRK